MEKDTSKYVSRMEQDDREIFERLCEQKEWFKELVLSKLEDRIDGIGLTFDERKVHIEIKQRTGKYTDFDNFIERFETIYLDTGKLDHLSNIMLISGASLNEKEIFVSIFNGGDVILIHNIDKAQPVYWLPKQNVYNPVKDERETEHKVGYIWWEAAMYYKNKDGIYNRLNTNLTKEEEIEIISIMTEKVRTSEKPIDMNAALLYAQAKVYKKKWKNRPFC